MLLVNKGKLVMERKVLHILLNPVAVVMLEYWRHFSGGAFFPINRLYSKKRSIDMHLLMNKFARQEPVTSAKKHEKLKVRKTLFLQNPHRHRDSCRWQLSDKIAFRIPGSFPPYPLRKVLL